MWWWTSPIDLHSDVAPSCDQKPESWQPGNFGRQREAEPTGCGKNQVLAKKTSCCYRLGANWSWSSLWSSNQWHRYLNNSWKRSLELNCWKQLARLHLHCLPSMARRCSSELRVSALGCFRFWFLTFCPFGASGTATDSSELKLTSETSLCKGIRGWCPPGKMLSPHRCFKWPFFLQNVWQLILIKFPWKPWTLSRNHEVIKFVCWL